MPIAEYVAAVMADTPRAFYKMDEASGLPQDSSGNGLHMDTTLGTPTYRVAGPPGASYAIEMPASCDFTRAAVVSSSVNNFTLEVWFYLISCLANGRNVFANDSTGVGGWGIQVDIAGTWAAYRDLTALTNSPTILRPGVWNQLVVRRGTTWQVFLNGELNLDPAGAGTPGAPTTGTQIGAGTNLNCRMALVSVTESALSDARIRERYHLLTDSRLMYWTRAKATRGRSYTTLTKS